MSIFEDSHIGIDRISALIRTLNRLGLDTRHRLLDEIRLAQRFGVIDMGGPCAPNYVKRSK